MLIAYLFTMDTYNLILAIILRYIIKLIIGIFGTIPILMTKKWLRSNMRTSKSNLVSDELKPVVGKIIRENRIKYNYSLEDLSQALEHKKIDKHYINTKQDY